MVNIKFIYISSFKNLYFNLYYYRYIVWKNNSNRREYFENIKYKVFNKRNNRRKRFEYFKNIFIYLIYLFIIYYLDNKRILNFVLLFSLLSFILILFTHLEFFIDFYIDLLLLNTFYFYSLLLRNFYHFTFTIFLIIIIFRKE